MLARGTAGYFAIAVLVLAVDATRGAEADLSSQHFILRSASLTSAAVERASGDAGLVQAAGANAGQGSAIGKSTGEKTGIVVFGGLWPALVGAAFDQDRDLVPNVTDNCTLARNTLQVDADHDGYGNACDPDFNEDGVVNFADLAHMRSAFFTTDPVADLNGDGVVNFADLAIAKTFFFKKPGPAAGRP